MKATVIVGGYAGRGGDYRFDTARGRRANGPL
jgi:hypothetical protein